MKKKNAGIAFLLGALPLFQAGLGVLSLAYDEAYHGAYGEAIANIAQRYNGIAFLLLLLLGFSWGWAYVYLGHTLRAVAAFFSGSVINFSLFTLFLGGIGVIDGSYEVFKKYNDFATVFFTVTLVVMALAGMVLAVDAGRLALRHNRMVQEKQSGK